MSESGSLQQFLTDHTISAADELVQSEPGGLRCLACANRCVIADGRSGVCKVRQNIGGELRVPGNYVAGLQVDPIEKKPFYHVLPGSDAVSFGMLGCNFYCAFCQNWLSSQSIRDGASSLRYSSCRAEQIVELALAQKAPVVVSTYNEPLITADWAARVFELAAAQGLLCGFVSNGHATREVLEFLRPVMRLYKVDLKCFDEKHYREMGGSLRVVLRTLELLRELDYWVEVVTLVIPGFNDGQDELNSIARFLAGLSPDVPWHVTAFHPDYQMMDVPRTSVDDLRRAYEAGKEAGLNYVYAGNLPGQVGSSENTCCPNCEKALIVRRGFFVTENRIAGGACPECGTAIPGVWDSAG